MAESSSKRQNLKLARALHDFANLFNLLEDKAEDEVISNNIRAGVELKGTNLWVLIFAILVASIGLNMNSTAVVIGAMLISPLMGPIMGIGYGVGIYDSNLIRKSLRNLALSTGISLSVSFLYFLISPISFAHSELLARTTPTIWDVLIAFFGGLAGIIGATRGERSNIIPGVAIATALMPPLCTAGFGLAHANWEYFFGALYLYSINCVYIAFSAVLIVWVIHPEHKHFVDKITESRVKRTLSLVVFLTMLPSIYLAVHLVKHEVFASKATAFMKNELALPDSHIASSNVDAKSRLIEITMIGEMIDDDQLKQLKKRLIQYDLGDASLILHQAKNQSIDVSALKSNIVSDLYKENLMALELKNEEISEKDEKIRVMEAELKLGNIQKATWIDVANEISTQYPDIDNIYLSEAVQWQKNNGKIADNLIMLNLHSNTPIPSDAQDKISAWLKVRIKNENVKVIVDAPTPKLSTKPVSAQEKTANKTNKQST